MGKHKRGYENFPGQMQLAFEELQKAQEQKKESPAPLPFFAHPQNDNETLLQYQYQYIREGKETALSKMYTRGYTVALSFIAMAKRNGNIKKLEI